MERNDTFCITISFYRDKVTRKFGSSYDQTTCGIAFNGISKPEFAKPLATALRKVHGVDSPNLENLIVEKVFNNRNKTFGEQPVQWYMSEFFEALRASKSGRGSMYYITIKACLEHLFYKLEVLNDEGNRELIHGPFFQKAPPPMSAEQGSDIRGLADTLFFSAPLLNRCYKESEHENELLESLIHLLSWFQIQLGCTISSKLKDTFDIQITPEVDINKYISLPFKEDKRSIEDRRILVASPNVRAAITNVFESCHNPTAKSVLISAWTGSGKEVLVNLLTDAMRISAHERIDISSPGVGKFDEFRNRIAAKLKPQKRTIVFLDEVHHDSAESLRSGLLRLMETDKLETESRDIDCRKILYVLAASLPPEQLRNIKPLDLWTRIEYTVVLRHPLMIDDDKVREDTLRDYFLHFWREQKRQGEGLNKKNIVNRIINVLLDEKAIDCFSDIFVEMFGSPLIPLISIRTLRTITKRLFGKAVTHFRMHPELLSEPEKVGEEARRLCRQWIKGVFNEVVPEIDTKGLF